MPQFYTQTPKSQGDMKKVRESATKESLPIGVIGENSKYEWGYTGNTYYVTTGVFKYIVTTAKLSLEEAKTLYNALSFLDLDNIPEPTEVTKIIKSGRKTKLDGDELLWWYIDELSQDESEG